MTRATQKSKKEKPNVVTVTPKTQVTVYHLVEDKYDHRSIGIFDAQDKAEAAAEAVVKKNPRRYQNKMQWRTDNGFRLYCCESERQYFIIIPREVNTYFDGLIWRSSVEV